MLLIVIMGNAFNWKFYFSEQDLKVNTEKKTHHWNCFGKKKEEYWFHQYVISYFLKLLN